jgi:hypothetical protein
MDIPMHKADWAIVFATLFGPIFAIQAQTFINWLSERKRRRVGVYRALMGSRATPNSPDHVNALNAVPLEFKGKRRVMDAYSDLLLHLNTDSKAHPDDWTRRHVTLFTALLLKMGNSLGYKFREAELQGHVYFPEWQVQLMKDQESVRQGMVALMSGVPVNMKVTGFPVDEDALKAQKALNNLLIEWLEGKHTPKVSTESGKAPEAQ